MRHTILISAFSCLPNRGSEPGVGWNWALQAAKTQNVYVITRTKCKSKIEAEIPQELKESLRFIYCDSSKKLRGISIYLEYLHWQLKAYFNAKKLCKNINFDYVIHLTFGNVFLPTLMYKLPVPFIWGPLGGGEKVPHKFYKEFKFKKRIPHIIKDAMIKTIRINPCILLPAKHSKLIITRTEDTRDIFPQRFQNKIILKLETCLGNTELEALTKINENKKIDKNKFNLVVTGRLIPFKNNEILIDVMKNISELRNDIVLHIIGDGELRNSLQSKVEKYKLNNQVIFYGQISRDETLSLVNECDIFVFPSLREGGSWSLMEAMLLKKPIICLEGSGMKIITDENCAIRIPMDNKENILKNMTDSVLNLYNNPNLLISMGNESKKRIEEYYKWDYISEFIVKTLEMLDKK